MTSTGDLFLHACNLSSCHSVVKVDFQTWPTFGLYSLNLEECCSFLQSTYPTSIASHRSLLGWYLTARHDPRNKLKQKMISNLTLLETLNRPTDSLTACKVLYKYFFWIKLLLVFLLLWQWRRMKAIWIPIQWAWGVGRNPGCSKANTSIASKVCT